MSIVTIPAMMVKGQPAQITLHKEELALHPLVQADSYMREPANWKNVLLTYQSSSSDQRREVSFDATAISPVANLLISANAIGTFKIERVVITDFDGGSLVIPKFEIDVTQFNVPVSLKVAPSQMITEVITNKSFRVGSDAEFFEGDYAVLYDTVLNDFLNEPPQKVVSKASGVINFENAFGGTIQANRHVLRFPHIKKCSVRQATNYYFNS